MLTPSRLVEGGGATGKPVNRVRPGALLASGDADMQGDSSPAVALSYQRQVEAEDVGTMAAYSASSSVKFFCKHSYRDIGRRRCHFGLSFCSVLIVVWSALVINTLVEKGPVIFLKLAEGDEGQYDGLIYPTRDFDGMASYTNKDGIFVNYTQVLAVVGDKYNLAPRKQFCKSAVGSKRDRAMRERYDDEYNKARKEKEEASYRTTSDGKNTVPTRSAVYDLELASSVPACAMFLDTQRERDIDLGRRYQFEPLNEGECIIHEQLAESLQVGKGDMIYLQMDMQQNLRALLDIYNNQVATPSKRIEASILEPRTTRGDAPSSIRLPCRVAHVGDQSYGKIQKDQAVDQIYMEYKTIYKYIKDYLPPPLNSNRDFVNFLGKHGEQQAYQLADFLMMTLPQPRVKYYQSSNYFDIQRGVTSYANEVIDALGFFPVRM